MTGRISDLTHSVVQSNLVEQITAYSPNERMTLVIRGLIGLAILIAAVTIWFVWVTRKSNRSIDVTTPHSNEPVDGSTTESTVPSSQPVHPDESVD